MSRSRLHVLREVLLTTGAVLGTLCILAALAGTFLGVTPVVFHSGSMAPAVHTGDLGVVRSVPLDSLEAGDIVSVVDDRGVRITHRLVSMTSTGNSATLVLKGDANEDPDPQPYVVTHADRMLFSVPAAGYLLAWLSGPVGVFLGALLVGLVLLVLLRRPRGDAAPPDRPRHRSAGSATAVAVGVALVVAGGVLPPRVAGTLAAWTDAAPVTGVTTNAYTVPAPVIASCAASGNTTTRTVTLTFPGVTSPGTSYAADVTPITTTGVTVAGTSTRTVAVSYSPTGTNRSKLVTVAVTPSVTGTPAWTGPADTWQFLTAANGNAPTCGEKTAPTVAITAPDTTTRTSAAEITYMNSGSGCANNSRPACGTMADGSTISSVSYVFQRVQAGTTSCWSGTGWQAGCGSQVGTIASQTTWRIGGSNATAYATPGGAYTLTVVVTDQWGNATTVTRSFTVTA